MRSCVTCEEVEGHLFMGWGYLRTRKNVIDDRATSPEVWGQKGGKTKVFFREFRIMQQSCIWLHYLPEAPIPTRM